MNYKAPCDLNQSSHAYLSSGFRITPETNVFDSGLLNYGAKFIVRGGAYETMEGNARNVRFGSKADIAFKWSAYIPTD